MRLTSNQLHEYETRGFLLLPGLLAGPEVEILRREVQVILSEDARGRMLENDGRTVRAAHGSHRTSEILHDLVRLPRLLAPAEQILGSAAYVHQFKINAKAAFGGDVWQWHQDHIFWAEEDGMPTSRVVNVLVFIDRLVAIVTYNSVDNVPRVGRSIRPDFLCERDATPLRQGSDDLLLARGCSDGPRNPPPLEPLPTS